MTDYDQITASHYEAYRPPLHVPILRKHVANRSYERGLDVGCGAGQSALALTHFCGEVLGVEPSRAMLEQAIPHARVQYQYYDGTRFSFPNDYFDLITFAGSWYYAKSQHILDEVVRVGRRNGLILLYDFDLLLQSVLDRLLPKGQQVAPTDYDHQACFDGFDQSRVQQEGRWQDQITIDISSADLAHLLLSVKETYEALAKKYGESQLWQTITQQLGQKARTIIAKTYATVYCIQK